MKLMINFTDAQSDSICRMADKLDVSKSEVIRKAMSLFSIFVNEPDEHTIAIVKDNEIVKDIVGIK